MVVISKQYTLPIGKSIDTYPTTSSNRISKTYYNMLIGEINRGTIFKALCRIENKTFGVESYYLISQP